MIGAIIGDIVGSIYEFHNHKSKEFEFFNKRCFFTDDTVMTLAICDAFLRYKEENMDLASMTIKCMHDLGNSYDAGYGGMFARWLRSTNPEPYNSFGNGAAMRVSACAYAGKTIEEARHYAKIVTEISHNHPEGIKGAVATTDGIFLARLGKSIKEIKDHITKTYYSIDFTLDEIRKTYYFNETCQGTVPQAMEAFFESKDFEDAIRNAISIGGDSDTLGAITGSLAEAYYGVPESLRLKAYEFLDDRLLKILHSFEKVYPNT
ncbi:MAG: ADP-ribosylglycohydrolase family protein [Desulfovibrionaceae bacterium]|nr:ADP-ribosylglycohydrolase family protein [Desulfovibrionaceae bacterium]